MASLWHSTACALACACVSVFFFIQRLLSVDANPLLKMCLASCSITECSARDSSYFRRIYISQNRRKKNSTNGARSAILLKKGKCLLNIAKHESRCRGVFVYVYSFVALMMKAHGAASQVEANMQRQIKHFCRNKRTPPRICFAYFKDVLGCSFCFITLAGEHADAAGLCNIIRVQCGYATVRERQRERGG